MIGIFDTILVPHDLSRHASRAFQIAARLAHGAGMLVAPGDLYGAPGADHVRLALVQPRDRRALRGVGADVQHLRYQDGSYWTGWQFTNGAHYPAERSAWTAAPLFPNVFVSP